MSLQPGEIAIFGYGGVVGYDGEIMRSMHTQEFPVGESDGLLHVSSSDELAVPPIVALENVPVITDETREQQMHIHDTYRQALGHTATTHL